MKNGLLVVQIILSIILAFLILLQGKGGGLGHPFFGNIGIYSTRRGMEKIVYYLTIAIAVLFFLSSLAQLLII